MSGYYNILPTILIDIFIILLFEGLVFFLYLIKQEEQIISKELGKFLLIIRQKEENITDPLQKKLIETAREQINNYMPIVMKQDQKYIETLYKNGLIIYLFTLLAIIIILFIYSYIVKYKLNKTIDWGTIFIIVFITIILIIIMELLYIKYVLFNKKFNDSQIQLDFINALAN
jgi:hypothetical protein